MIKIPNTDKKYSQTNNGDVLGSLFYTKNIDFDKLGYLSLARKTTAIYLAPTSNSAGETPSDFSVGYNAVYDTALNGGQYAISTEQGIYNMTADTLVVTRDDTSGNPTSSNDCFYWNSALYNAYNGTTGILKRSATGVWAVGGVIATLTNTDFHTFCLNEITNELLVTDGNLIKKITTGDTVTTACTLPSNFRARWIVLSNNRFFIGTVNTNGGNGKVFYWDGVSTAATISYDINSQIAVSGCKYKSTVACVNALGQLMVFDGSGFTQIASLPVYNELEFWANTTTATGMYVPMYPKSMNSRGDYIYMNVGNNLKGRSNGNLPNFPAGVWCYDPLIGLYHKYSPTPFTDTTGYGSILTSNVDSGIMAFLAEPNITGYLPELTVGSDIIFSCRVPIINNTASANLWNVICSPVSGENRGYFVTNKIYSNNITDMWQKCYVKYRGLYDANDIIKIKYRVGERTKIPLVAGSKDDTVMTWATTTTFTTTSTLLASVVAGDEFEIWCGVNAGKTAKVVSNTLAGSTYTVVLDTAIGTVGSTVGGSFWNWTDLGSITYTDTLGYKEIPIGKNGKFIQFKIELEGEGVQIEEFRIINKIQE
jgi:hypothetical protein